MRSAVVKDPKLLKASGEPLSICIEIQFPFGQLKLDTSERLVHHLLTVQTYFNSLVVGTKLMITCQYHQTCNKARLGNNPGLETICADSLPFEHDYFCFTSHHPFQKLVDLGTIQQRLVDGNSIHEIINSCGAHTSCFFRYPVF